MYMHVFSTEWNYVVESKIANILYFSVIKYFLEHNF